MASLEDKTLKILERAFDVNYSSAVLAQDCHLHIQSPLSFYDRHVDRNLVLKAVKALPFPIAPYLSKYCDQEVKHFFEQGYKLNTKNLPVYPTDLPDDFTFGSPSNMACYYAHIVGAFGFKLFSKLYFIPNSDIWHSVFHFKYRSRGSFSAEGTFAVVREEIFPRELDDNRRSILKELASHSPGNGAWEFFALTQAAETLVREMGPISPFPWESHHTTGHHPQAPLVTPLDSKIGISAKIAELTVNAKVFKSSEISAPQPSTNVVTPMRRGSSRKEYRPLPKHYLQHIWARAVETDSTFIVINCGTLERIGIRHRQSQTLYLSDLIDPIHCKDPSYRKAHMGLMFSLMQDALDRQMMRQAADLSSNPQPAKKYPVDSATTNFPRGKRVADTDITSDNIKRRKTEDDLHSVDGADSPSHKERELSTRELILVNLSYGIYQSPVPASFIRLGPSCARQPYIDTFKKVRRKVKYSRSQYFALTLGKPLAEGAIGIVHSASANMELNSRTVTQDDLVIKLAISKEQQDGIRHEFNIYQHLAQNSVIDGIVRVYGLFEDMDTGILALVMDHAGVDIGAREEARSGRTYPMRVTNEEQQGFIQTLQGIHRSGITHGDIRMNNLSVKETNQAFIIDFDRAEFNPPVEAYEEEFDDLKNIFDIVT